VWLYHYVASTVCRDTKHIVLARIIKLQALTELYNYEEALLTLSELLLGNVIQQGSHGGDDKHSELHWVGTSCHVHMYMYFVCTYMYIILYNTHTIHIYIYIYIYTCMPVQNDIRFSIL